MANKKNDLVKLISQNSCFDLQFRRDIRRERLHSPTYYRWKAQFVITLPLSEVKNLEKIQANFSCGKIYLDKYQARFCVQKISEIKEKIIPSLRKDLLQENKRKEFELWAKAIEILYKNRNKPFLSWKKSDFLSLIEIQKSCLKYKKHPRRLRWLEIAQQLVSHI